MTQLVIADLEETVWHGLRARAQAHGRSAEAEARLILAEALRPKGVDAWAQVNAIRERLASSGRVFSDSTELLREDRDR